MWGGETLGMLEMSLALLLCRQESRAREVRDSDVSLTEVGGGLTLSGGGTRLQLGWQMGVVWEGGTSQEAYQSRIHITIAFQDLNGFTHTFFSLRGMGLCCSWKCHVRLDEVGYCRILQTLKTLMCFGVWSKSRVGGL